MSSRFESIKHTSDILTYSILTLLVLILILYWIRNICRSPTIADSVDDRNIYEMASINDIDIDASNDNDFPSRVILQFRD